MSLKITDENGFKIGGVLNPSITEIYVRALCDMTKQSPLQGENGIVNEISIKTNAKTTIAGGLFAPEINVDFIYKQYWTKYSTSVSDMNEQYFEIETDLMNQILVANPEWQNKIEIVTLGV